jgi:hypothetical protein
MEDQRLCEVVQSRVDDLQLGRAQRGGAPGQPVEFGVDDAATVVV